MAYVLDGMAMKDRDMEQEANRFACELLMPFDMLVSDVKAAKLDLTDDAALGKLAKKYAVPVGVLAFHLGVLRGEGEI